jgi:hypothetical protein
VTGQKQGHHLVAKLSIGHARAAVFVDGRQKD